tara:strand:+ start:198 stop:584 length:387 start_codon:yes stop_codon:yes gene_type:complete
MISRKGDFKRAIYQFNKIVLFFDLLLHQKMTILGLSDSHDDYTKYVRWVTNQDLEGFTTDTLLKIYYMIGIYKSLRILFPTKEQAVDWLRNDSMATVVGPYPPLSRIISGDTRDLKAVNDHLNSLVIV